MNNDIERKLKALGTIADENDAFQSAVYDVLAAIAYKLDTLEDGPIA
jgi:hypothetical protein